VFLRVSHASISKGRAHNNIDEEGRVTTGSATPPSQRAEPTVTQMRKDVLLRVSHASISKGRAHGNIDEEGRVPTGQPRLHLKGQSPQ